MISELYDHSKQSWNHVLSGESTLSEKVEVGLEAMVAAGAVAAAARFGWRAINRPGFIGRAESALATGAESGLPELKITGVAETRPWTKLQFGITQRIQQGAAETSAQLHERLRPQVLANMTAVRQPTEIVMPSWYTADVSKTLGIDDAVAVMTSTCKHETPYLTFVGRRIPSEFMQSVPWHDATRYTDKVRISQLEQLGGKIVKPTQWQYRLYDLGRELTAKEKNAIYDLI